MKSNFLFWSILLCLLAMGPLQAQQGLTGTYYNGTNFEQQVLTRIDPQIRFDWSNGGCWLSITRRILSESGQERLWKCVLALP